VDLTHLPLVTIDGETAKDFDDAVYCESEGKGFRLWVGIADVSHYTKHGDGLDLEARARGNSVYFPRRVIPMLPEALSNGLCSLNPEVERLCLTCEMLVGARGDIKDYRFYPAVMRSHARLTYTKVAEILADPGGEEARRQNQLAPHLQNLHSLFHVLVKARERRGAIDFESVETRMEFGRQRLRVGLSATARASGALPDPRGAHTRQVESSARVPARIRIAAGRRRRSARQRLRQAAERDPRSPRLPIAADRAAALLAAGDVQS
jgi:VacB/RNase II family 3'-5' exoribonuclease